MREIKLKPCPFCGTEAYTSIERSDGEKMRIYIQCNDSTCGAKMDFTIKPEGSFLNFYDVFSGINKAVEAWNRGHIMRLIDADELMMCLRCNVLIDVTPELEKEIEQQPTVFDKEKVRRELIELRNEEVYKPDSINKYTEARSQGRYSAFLDAIRIGEEGGQINPEGQK